MRIHTTDTDIPQATVLVVGDQPPRLHAVDLLIQVVGAATLDGAMRELKRRAFDLLIVQTTMSGTREITWVKRLRAAKPYLPVVVNLDPRDGAVTSEARLRAAGVSAVVTNQNLEDWLEHWWLTWAGKYVEKKRQPDHPVNWP